MILNGFQFQHSVDPRCLVGFVKHSYSSPYTSLYLFSELPSVLELFSHPVILSGGFGDKCDEFTIRFQWVSDEELEAPEEAPPSPDRVPGPEHPPLSVYVSEPEYPKKLSYIADSDPEEDEKDPEEDPADYPADGGDDDDDDESSDDDDNDDDMILSPQAEDTKAFETDEFASTLPTSPHHIILFSDTKPRTSRMSIRPHTLPSPSTEACIAEFAAALPSSSLPPSVSPPPENIKSLRKKHRGQSN
ncbi:hypothetical protein Tco_0719319 [Tanacetum coccineum]